MGDTCSTKEGEVHVGFCWGNPWERNDLEELGHGWEDKIKLELQKLSLGYGLHSSGSGWGQVEC